MTRINRSSFFIYLLLLLFLIIAYLPLSSSLFALKNDALTANFPNKYFFSASLKNGYLPIWNPYINFGLPLYADPGFAFWNPITWIFGWIGYSVPVLSVEILFYIWIAGITAYELGIFLGHNKRVSFCLGIMYMSCGFFIGNLQHTNFLTCAAFLPLVLRSCLALQNGFNIRRLFFCLISLYFLGTGGHPAIPVACIYFLFVVQIGAIIFNEGEENKKQAIIRLIKTDLILIVCFLVLALPLFYSYYEIYPHFTRANPVLQSSYSDTGFDISSYLSFIFPFSTSGNSIWFHNDPLMRNGYFSLVGFFCFLIALFRNQNYFQKIFLLAGSFMFLLSLGGPVKEILYPLLPFLDHIRTNGEFRIFGILSFLLVGSFILNDLLEGRNMRIFRNFLLIIAGICLVIVVGHFIYAPSSNFFIPDSQKNSATVFFSIKSWLDTLTFLDRLFINATILLIIICLYFLLIRKIKNRILLPLFIITDLVVFSWTNLPVTGIQLLSPFDIQKYFIKVPSGIPIPSLKPIAENRYLGKDLSRIIGCWSYYSKQPGTPFQCDYPTRLNSTSAYFKSSMTAYVNQKPFVFLSGQALQQNIHTTSFTPSEVVIQVKADCMDTLILLQNDYFRWKCFINGKSVDIQPYAIAFMSVPINTGNNTVSFFYDYHKLVIFTIFSALAWIAFIFVVLLNKAGTGKKLS
jgi:hypothetical protein